MTEDKITEEMTIREVIDKYPETMPVFFNHNIGCVGCPSSSFEKIKDIAMVHGTDVKAFVRDLNAAIKKK